ncbi:MAG TPA: DUF2069 domain-containing protein [Steroidobacteraceae bacterium]
MAEPLTILRARRGVLATLALLGVVVVIAAALTSAWPRSLALAAAYLLPLAPPLPGLLLSLRRTHAWATLCVIPYLVFGVTETVANPALRAVGACILFAALAVFVALVWYLRVTRPEGATEPAAGPQAPA